MFLLFLPPATALAIAVSFSTPLPCRAGKEGSRWRGLVISASFLLSSKNDIWEMRKGQSRVAQIQLLLLSFPSPLFLHCKARVLGRQEEEISLLPVCHSELFFYKTWGEGGLPPSFHSTWESTKSHWWVGKYIRETWHWEGKSKNKETLFFATSQHHLPSYDN